MAGNFTAQILGRLGRDPEMRYLQDGTAVTNVSIAVGQSWVGQDGQRNEKTAWYDVSFFGRRAEVVAEHLQKGQEVLIVTDRPIEVRAYTNRDGEAAAAMKVTASGFSFVGSKSDNNGSGYSAPADSPAAAAPPLDEEDVPF